MVDAQEFHSYHIALNRALAIASLTVNLIFYVYIIRLRRLTEAIHWYICNFIICEVLKDVALIMRGVMDAALAEIPNRRLPNNLTMSDATKAVFTVLQTESILDTVVEVGILTGMVFALITMTKFYKNVKFPFASERYSKRCLIYGAIIWSIFITYFAVVATLRTSENLKTLQLVFWLDDVSTAIFGILYVVCCMILFAFSIVLLTNISKTDPTSSDGTMIVYAKKMEQSFQKTKIRKMYLLIIMIVCFMVFSAMQIYISVVELRIENDEVPTSIEYSRSIVETATFLFASALGVLWPFVWIYLDETVKQELRNTFEWFKSVKPHIKNEGGEIFKRRRF